MKQTWDSDTIDSMIENIEKIELEIKIIKTSYFKYIAGVRPGHPKWSEDDAKGYSVALGCDGEEK